MKTTIYTTDMNESRAIGCAAGVLASLPRTGPIVATSLRVERDGAESIVIHLESGEDVGVPRRPGETWAQAIDRFNTERSEDVNEESERRRGGVPQAEGPIEEMRRGM